MHDSADAPVADHGRRRTQLGILLAAGYWLLETVVHSLLFEPYTFELIPASYDEIWMRLTVCALVILLGVYADRALARLAASERERRALHQRLETSLTTALSGFISICASCKRIHEKPDEWVPIESYVGARTKAEFSHSICPECAPKLFPGTGIDRS